VNTATLDDRRIAQAIAYGRVGIGISALLAPRRLTGMMFGVNGTDAEPVMLARMAGARDLALGVATLAALDRGLSPSVAVGLAAGCDIVDSAAGFVGRGLAGRARVLTAMLAIPAAVLGVRAARTLGGSA
jgi:hypothetical protein